MNSHHTKSVKGEKIIALAMCVILGLIAIFNPFNKTTESILLSFLIIAVSIIPYFVWKRKKNRNLIILGVFYYGFFHLVGYGLAGLTSHEIATSWIVENISDANEHIAKILVIAHLLIVFGGWYILQLFFKSSEPTGTSSNPKVSITAYRMALLWCVLLTLVELFKTMNIPPFASMTGIWIGTIRFLAYMYLFYFLFYLNFGGRVIKILAVIGLLMAQGALLGFGQIGLYLEVGLIFILIRLQKGRMPVAIFASLAVAFVILQPMKGAVRGMGDYGGYGFVDSMTAGFETVQEIDSLALVDIATKRIDYNLLFSSFVEHIGVRDEDDYIGWKGYKNLLYTFIPRILWEDKPEDNFANEWAVQEGYLEPNNYLTSYNLPWLPQMYLSFGVAGIIIGSFVIAIILFLLEKYYWTIRLDPWSFAIGYSILRPMLKLEADFAMIFGLVIKVIIIDIAVRVIRAFLSAIRQNRSVIDRSNDYLKNG